MSERGETKGEIPDVLMHVYEVAKYREYIEAMQRQDPNAQIVGKTARTQNYDCLAIAGEEFMFDKPPLWHQVRRLLRQDKAVNIKNISEASRDFARFLLRDHQGKIDRADAVLSTVQIGNAIASFKEDFRTSPLPDDVVYANRLKAFGYKSLVSVFNRIPSSELLEDYLDPASLFTGMLGEGAPKTHLLMNLELLQMDTHEVHEIVKENNLSDLVANTSKAEQQQLRATSTDLAKNLQTAAEYGVGSLVVAGRDIGLDCDIIIAPPEEFSEEMPEENIKSPGVLANFIFVESQDVHNTSPTREEEEKEIAGFPILFEGERIKTFMRLFTDGAIDCGRYIYPHFGRGLDAVANQLSMQREIEYLSALLAALAFDAFESPETIEQAGGTVREVFAREGNSATTLMGKVVIPRTRILRDKANVARIHQEAETKEASIDTQLGGIPVRAHTRRLNGYRRTETALKRYYEFIKDTGRQFPEPFHTDILEGKRTFVKQTTRKGVPKMGHWAVIGSGGETAKLLGDKKRHPRKRGRKGKK